MKFKLDGTIKIGDLLTSLTIAISVIALIATWTNDQRIRERQQADVVRTAAAETLGKLERWQSVYLSMYGNLQPHFVEASQVLAKDFDVVATRDFLWRKMNETRAKTLATLSDEEIEIAYVRLYGYSPGIRALFLTTMDNLKIQEREIFGRLLIESESAVLFFESVKREDYTTASLGNVLRKTAQKYEQSSKSRLTDALAPATEFLAGLIQRSDKEILGLN